MKKIRKIQSFPVIVEHDKHGWYANCPVLEACYTEGDSYEDLLKNMREVISLCLEDKNVSRTPRTLKNFSISLVDVALPA